MKVRIVIDTKSFIRFWLVIIGFALAGLGLFSARTALIILGVSFFLAMALNVPVTQISKRLPGKSRVGATALSYIMVVVILVGVVTFVVPPIVQQTAKFAANIPATVDTITTQWDGVNELIDKYNLREQVDTALQSIKDNASTWAANVGQGVVTSIGSVFSFFTAALLVFVLTFLMLVEGPLWRARLFAMYRDKQKMEQHRRISDKMYAVVTGYVTGQLTVSAIGAAAAALAVFILSLIFPVIPGNLAFPTAAITFVLSLIPMFGATIGGVLVALLLAFNNLPAGIIYIIYFIIYQQVENNFISPHIQAKKIDLSALAVLASVTIGIYVFGVVGGIIAIPIAGCIRVLIEEYMTKAARKREEEIDHHHKGFLGKLIEKYQASHEAKEAEKEA
jgi:predicted PurR-regulated permease PerM